jgi:ABC-type multidrug transport system fused ATPase/permease subunit
LAFLPPQKSEIRVREHAAAARVYQVIAGTPTISSPPTQSVLLPSCPDLSLQHVTFRYQAGETAVLHDFSLTIPYGQHILLTGESGGGKSSLVNILLRFAEYEKGTIQIGGQDLRTVPHEALRRMFAVMTQSTYLFNTTIGENIRIGRPGAAMTEIVAAARKAQVHSFISRLPQGYDTFVGESGVLLSGGERQRIALARMLLREAPIWILDEVTANLDAETARDIQLVIQQLTRACTVLTIAHRLSPFIKADKVLSLKNGRATLFQGGDIQ